MKLESAATLCVFASRAASSRRWHQRPHQRKDGIPGAPGLSLLIVRDILTENVSASFDKGEISVTIPRPLFEHWLEPQEVGISAMQVLADGKSLSILIEKDFPCLTPRTGEDDTDAFARPG